MPNKPFKPSQLRSLITVTLKEQNLYSEGAVELLMGTCAQESGFGQYTRQIRGPARGVFQMEESTFNWLKTKYLKRFPILEKIQFSDLENSVPYSLIMCRLRYLVVKEPIPHADDLTGLAQYWKKYYNTELGAGTVRDFIRNYYQYVLNVAEA